MHIAILGAGFAGLSTAWHLLNYTQGSVTIDLFDPHPIGQSNSGLSSGLLHGFSGKYARESFQAEKGMKETHRLLTVSSNAIRESNVLSNGILRPAVTEEQIINFQESVSKNSALEWWSKEKCEEKIPGLFLPPEGGGIYIQNALTVDVQNYLQGLWQACALLGTQLHKKQIIQSADMQKFDKIIFATGPQTKNIPFLKNLPVNTVKGQLLELEWPGDTPPLPMSLISQKYLVMSKDQKSCFAGATFEHKFQTLEAEREIAVKDILPKIQAYFPALTNAPIRSCRVGFRASSPNHLPMLGKVNDNIFYFTALGSKGLLYHAWLGKRMARAVLSGDDRHFPPQFHHKLQL